MLTIQTFECYRGDSAVLEIPLMKGGAAFSPGGAYTLLFTLKRASDDGDRAALAQKATGGLGITVNASTATVELTPPDTTWLPATTYVWDIQAQETATGRLTTVAIGRLTLAADITQGAEPVVPIHTTQPPAMIPAGGVQEMIDDAIAAHDADAEAHGGVSAGGVVGRPLPTGYTGGGATDIHSVATAALAAGTIVLTPNMPPGRRQWQVIASTAAEDIPGGLIIPTDHNPLTNAKALEVF